MATSDFALLTVENTGGALALKRKGAAEVVPESASPVIGAASGNLVVIPDAAGERVLRPVKVNIEAVQSGSGDPAPDNVRPFTGWTGANIYVSPTSDPEDGQTYSVTFPTEAGTVYGGVLDLTAGTLTVTWQMKMASSISWGRVNDPYYNLNYFYTVNTYIKGAGHRNMLKCSAYKPVVNDYFFRASDLTIGNIYARGNNINIRDDRFESLTEWRDYIAEHDFQIVWGIEPVTYQLTPVQIAALAGLNNIWADCGPVDVEWVRDTGAVIEAVDARAMVAELSGGTASRSLAVGEYVTVGNKLYRVTSAIGAGETLTPGSNVTETTVGAELTALYNLINS